MGRIYARNIHDGKMTLDQVPARWRQATIDAYWDIYGIHLED